MNSLIFLSFYLFWITVILFTSELKKAGTELPENLACFDLDSQEIETFSKSDETGKVQKFES